MAMWPWDLTSPKCNKGKGKTPTIGRPIKSLRKFEIGVLWVEDGMEGSVKNISRLRIHTLVRFFDLSLNVTYCLLLPKHSGRSYRVVV